MGTPVTNFGKVTVSTGYSSAATSIVLSSGHGSRLPSTFTYPLTWWNFTDYPDPADDPNVEIVTVTARSGDTLTVTRGAESTSASNKNTSGKTYKMLLGITEAMWDSIFDLSLSQDFLNLNLQTHPDVTASVNKVQLTHADAIVMDTGEEISTWDDLTADITAAGAGGLDAGTEQASTWYSVWAIYNGTTKNIMLHREKDYFLDEDSSAGEDGQHLLRDASARTKLSQGFQVDTAGLIEFVDVKLIKVGTPTGQYWLTIETNSGGVPSGTVQATSDKYDISRLTTTAGWVRIPFRTPFSVSAATQYHLVLQGDFTISGSNHMGWRADTSAGAYANGAKAAYDGATWTSDSDDDFVMKIYVTRNDTTVTMPSGYDRKARIGFVYNNGSSNFKQFHQKDRYVFTGKANYKVATSLVFAASPTLVDLSSFVPPLPVSAVLTMYPTSSFWMHVGNLTGTDLTGNAGTVDWVFASSNYVEGSTTKGTLPVLVDYQAIMFGGSAGGTTDAHLLSYLW